MDFNIKTETADMLRKYGRNIGMEPAAPQFIAPGMEQVSVEPFVALKLRTLFVEFGNWDDTIRHIIKSQTI